MRTTIDLADEILRLAVERAAEERIPLDAVVDAALRSYLTSPMPTADYKLRWRTERGTLLPGVDLDSRDALFDRMNTRR